MEQTGDENVAIYQSTWCVPHSLDPLTLTSDQDRHSLCNINKISSRQVMRIKKNINWK